MSDLRLSDVPAPQRATGICLVEVAACGICGSDVHILGGEIAVPHLPLTLGHEAAGIVRTVVDGVDGVAPGDRVFIDPMIVCGRCEACLVGRPHLCRARQIIGIHRDGALAELVAVPAGNLVPLPPDLDLLAASMIESAATPFHALTARAPSVAGEAVAVVGVGGLGFHAVAIARLLGASNVLAVDVREQALERALAHGATDAFLVEGDDVARAIRRSTSGGVAVSLECVGRPETCVLAADVLRPGGVCVLMGVARSPLTGPTLETFVARELEVRGAFAYSRAEIDRLVALAAAGMLDLGAAVSETYPLAAVGEAVAAVRNKRTSPVRVVVTPGDAAQADARRRSASQSASSG
jgi:threonine dehydrogenase-like Zn-dependent dehydrogenase